MTQRTLPLAIAVLLLALAALVLGLHPGARAATTILVPGDHASIQAAVNAANDGDTIQVSGGPYLENVLINQKNDLTIQGKDVLVDGEAGMHCFKTYHGSNVTITGFTFTGGFNGFVSDGTPGIVLENCTFRDNNNSAVRLFASHGSVVTKCVFENAGWFSIQDQLSTDLVIAKNRFEGGASDSISLSLADGGDGSADALVSKNTIADAGSWAMTVGGQRIRVEKNRITGHGKGGIRMSETTVSGQCVIEKNTITGGKGAALTVEFDGHTVAKNKITGTNGAGIEIDGSDNVVAGNKVGGVAGNGLELGGEDNLVEKNKVTGAGGNGFDVVGTGHRVVKNAAKASGGWGLYDHSYGTQNDYEKNKFDSEFVEPP